jgi:ABC-type transport system involved in multi-copper enzyme maturation permease subunit
MSHSVTIAQKELRSSLNSPIAYVFIALFAVASWGIFFHVEKFFARDEASMRGFFDWIPWLLWGLAPALTMRLWADERRLGTWEILATTPVTTSALVIGKFLASWALLALALLFTLAIPCVVNSYGNLDWGPVAGGYLGALLLGAAYLALGLVASSLVQDQFVALVVAWALGLLTLLPGLPFWESAVNRGVADALRGFAFNSRFESIARGLIDARDVLFYATATAFLLVLNIAIVNWRRFSS